MLQKKNDTVKLNNIDSLDLGSGNVYTNALYTGTKTNWNDNNPGSYIGNDGTEHLYGKSPSLSFHKDTTNTLNAGAVHNIITADWYNNDNSVKLAANLIGVIGTDATNQYNSGVVFGSQNGTTWIGAGEGYRNLIGTLGAYNDEKLYLAADSDIRFYTHVANDASSYFNVADFNDKGIWLDTNAQLYRAPHQTNWIKGRDGALVRINSFNNSYAPILSSKTPSGSWELGSHSNEYLYFNYCTDTNYNANTNSPGAQIVFMPNGRIASPAIKWCFATASGTTWSIKQGNGIASIVHQSTGLVKVTLSQAAPNANYAVFVSGEAGGIGAEIHGVYNRTTTDFLIDNANNGGSATNLTQISILVLC